MRKRLSCGLLLLVFSSGCYVSHGLDESTESDSGPGFDGGSGFDAGPGFDAASDAGPGSDAGPPRCSSVKIRELLIAGPEAGGGVTTPDIFFVGADIGLVVTDNNIETGAHGVVSSSRVRADFSVVTPLRRVGEDTHGWGEAAWNGDGFGVCWSGDPGGVNALHFREVEGFEGALGERSNFGPGSSSCLELVFAHGIYVAAWRQNVEEGTAALVARVERDGSRPNVPINVGTLESGSYAPRIRATDDGFVVVTALEDSIRFMRLDGEANIVEDRSVSLPGVSYAEFDVRRGVNIRGGGEEFGVLALVGPRDSRRLEFFTYDSDFNLSARRELLDGAPTAAYPRIVAAPEGWRLIWAEGSRPSYLAMMLTLDPLGIPLAPRTVLHRGQHSGYGGPALAVLGDTTYVAIAHSLLEAPESGRQYVHLQEWRCSEEPRDLCAPQEILDRGDCEEPSLLGWLWNGEACEPTYACSSCFGASCAEVAPSLFACESDHRECLALRCEAEDAPVNEVCGDVEVVSGAPSWLTVGYGGDTPCPCYRPTCSVTAVGEFQLLGSLEYCPEDVTDCACFTPPPPQPTVRCEVPALAPGTWSIRFEGRPNVELVASRGPITSAPICR
ncbi:MAG: hypothetical protein ACI9KE_001676 [Polyangiales bacterium]|jgi:hypothetical protein